MEPQAGPFHVYAFQAAELDEDGNPEDVILSFNLGGIRMNEAAFRKLQQEITLEPLKVKLPPSLASSDKGEYRLFSATVPVDREIFRKIVVRESRIPRIDPGGLLGQGMDRALVLRSLHRSGDLCGPGKAQGREQQLEFLPSRKFQRLNEVAAS